MFSGSKGEEKLQNIQSKSKTLVDDVVVLSVIMFIIPRYVPGEAIGKGVSIAPPPPAPGPSPEDIRKIRVCCHTPIIIIIN